MVLIMSANVQNKSSILGTRDYDDHHQLAGRTHIKVL